MKTTDILPYVRLRFNVDNPSLDDCYLDGYEAAKHKIDEDDNPFELSSLENEYWMQGWWDHFYGNKPLFQCASNEEERARQPTIENSEAACNDPTFYGKEGKEATVSAHHSRMTLVAKVAAAVAATFLSYQVIDLIA